MSPASSWSSVKKLSFGLMGSKSYEKVYTLEKIEADNDHKIAVITMNTVSPSKKQSEDQVPDVFENIDSYSGQSKLDLTSGKIQESTEESHMQWTISDPTIGGQAENEQAKIIMTALRFYSIKMID